MGEKQTAGKKRTQTARRKENTGRRPELGKREAEVWENREAEGDRRRDP